MWKKIALSLLTFALTLASCLSLCCRVELDGRTLEGLYSPRVLYQAHKAARAAAEEICAGEAALPALRCRPRLALHPPEGSAAELSAAILGSTPGVMLASDVYVGGVRLGAVSGEAELRARLSRFVSGQQPSWAVGGFIRESALVRREYTRACSLTTLDDMALLISGISPVLYFDSDGYIARA